MSGTGAGAVLVMLHGAGRRVVVAVAPDGLVAISAAQSVGFCHVVDVEVPVRK
ncbi:hypothetical protein [Mycolicibacterium sp. lyk4-40-TYG-92]|uniref:hypothetical protein n=1 Tax=Mycolicibacterium sp. lyk4-40-TYG-92 TaxID=3040295 RepID=UPI00254C74B9|nr:hypothetical protein [Mycolicibacterium sp. lyk4-40-TYG-92]